MGYGMGEKKLDPADYDFDRAVLETPATGSTSAQATAPAPVPEEGPVGSDRPWYQQVYEAPLDLARGAYSAPFNVVKGIGQTTEYLGSLLGSEGMKDVGRGMSDTMKETMAGMGGPLAPSPEGKQGLVENVGEMAAMSMGPFALLKTLGLPLKMAAAATTPLFGVTQTGESWDNLKAQAAREGKSPEDMDFLQKATPAITGALDMIGEYYGTKALGKLFGAGAGGTIKERIFPSTKAYLKKMAFETYPIEAGTEMAQNYTEALTEKLTGVRPEAEPWNEAVSALAPTAGLTLLTGGIGRFHQRSYMKAANEVLENPEAPAGLRMRFVEGVSQSMKEDNLPFADQWKKYATQQVQMGKGIDVNMPLNPETLQIQEIIDSMSTELNLDLEAQKYNQKSQAYQWAYQSNRKLAETAAENPMAAPIAWAQASNEKLRAQKLAAEEAAKKEAAFMEPWRVFTGEEKLRMQEIKTSEQRRAFLKGLRKGSPQTAINQMIKGVEGVKAPVSEQTIGEASLRTQAPVETVTPQVINPTKYREMKVQPIGANETTEQAITRLLAKPALAEHEAQQVEDLIGLEEDNEPIKGTDMQTEVRYLIRQAQLQIAKSQTSQENKQAAFEELKAMGAWYFGTYPSTVAMTAARNKMKEIVYGQEGPDAKAYGQAVKSFASVREQAARWALEGKPTSKGLNPVPALKLPQRRTYGPKAPTPTISQATIQSIWEKFDTLKDKDGRITETDVDNIASEMNLQKFDVLDAIDSSRGAMRPEAQSVRSLVASYSEEHARDFEKGNKNLGIERNPRPAAKRNVMEGNREQYPIFNAIGDFAREPRALWAVANGTSSQAPEDMAYSPSLGERAKTIVLDWHGVVDKYLEEQGISRADVSSTVYDELWMQLQGEFQDHKKNRMRDRMPEWEQERETFIQSRMEELGQKSMIDEFAKLRNIQEDRFPQELDPEDVTELAESLSPEFVKVINEKIKEGVPLNSLYTKLKEIAIRTNNFDESVDIGTKEEVKKQRSFFEDNEIIKLKTEAQELLDRKKEDLEKIRGTYVYTGLKFPYIERRVNETTMVRTVQGTDIDGEDRVMDLKYEWFIPTLWDIHGGKKHKADWYLSSIKVTRPKKPGVINIDVTQDFSRKPLQMDKEGNVLTTAKWTASDSTDRVISRLEFFAEPGGYDSIDARQAAEDDQQRRYAAQRKAGREFGKELEQKLYRNLKPDPQSLVDEAMHKRYGTALAFERDWNPAYTGYDPTSPGYGISDEPAPIGRLIRKINYWLERNTPEKWVGEHMAGKRLTERLTPGEVRNMTSDEFILASPKDPMQALVDYAMLQGSLTKLDSLLQASWAISSPSTFDYAGFWEAVRSGKKFEFGAKPSSGNVNGFFTTVESPLVPVEGETTPTIETNILTTAQFIEQVRNENIWDTFDALTSGNEQARQDIEKEKRKFHPQEVGRQTTLFDSAQWIQKNANKFNATFTEAERTDLFATFIEDTTPWYQIDPNKRAELEARDAPLIEEERILTHPIFSNFTTYSELYDDGLINIVEGWAKMLGLNKAGVKLHFTSADTVLGHYSLPLADKIRYASEAKDKHHYSGLWGSSINEGAARLNSENPAAHAMVQGFIAGKNRVVMLGTPMADAWRSGEAKQQSAVLESLAHELGHIYMEEVFNSLPDPKKEAIFDAWCADVRGAGITTAFQWLNTHRPFLYRTFQKVPEYLNMRDFSQKRLEFKEWFADQTALWMTSQEKPLNVVQETFQDLGESLKTFYQTMSHFAAPARTFNDLASEMARTAVENVKIQEPKFNEATPLFGEMEATKKEISVLAKEPKKTEEAFAKDKQAVENGELFATQFNLMSEKPKETKEFTPEKGKQTKLFEVKKEFKLPDKKPRKVQEKQADKLFDSMGRMPDYRTVGKEMYKNAYNAAYHVIIPMGSANPDNQLKYADLAPRYAFHQPPSQLQYGRSGLRNGLKAYPTRGGGGIEDAIRGTYGGEFPNILWLSPKPDYGKGSFLVDLSKVNTDNLRLTGQTEGNLWHKGDIDQSAIVGYINKDGKLVIMPGTDAGTLGRIYGNMEVVPAGGWVSPETMTNFDPAQWDRDHAGEAIENAPIEVTANVQEMENNFDFHMTEKLSLNKRVKEGVRDTINTYFVKKTADIGIIERQLANPFMLGKRYKPIEMAVNIQRNRDEQRTNLIHHYLKKSNNFLRLEGKALARVEKALIEGDRELRNRYEGFLKKATEKKRDSKEAGNRGDIELAAKLLEESKEWSDKAAELKTQNSYSSAELKSKFGMSEDEVKVYGEVRQTLDDLHKRWLGQIEDRVFHTYRAQRWYGMLRGIWGSELSTEDMREAQAKLGGLYNAYIKTLDAARIPLKNLLATEESVGKMKMKMEQIVMRVMDDIANKRDMSDEKAQKIIDAAWKQIHRVQKMAAPELNQEQISAMVKAYKAKYTRVKNQIEEVRKLLMKHYQVTQPDITAQQVSEDIRSLMLAYGKTKPQMKELSRVRNELGKWIAYFPRERDDRKMHYIEVYKVVRDTEGKEIAKDTLYLNYFDIGAIGGEKLKAEAQKVAEQMALENGWDAADVRVKWDRNIRQPESTFFKVSDQNTQAVIDNALQSVYIKSGMGKEDSDKIRQELIKGVADVLNQRGFGKHKLKRSVAFDEQGNIRTILGYKETGLREVLKNYITGYAGMETKQLAAIQYTELLSSIPKELPGIRDYVHRYSQENLRNQERLDRANGFIRSLAFVWYLGASLKAPFVQLTQNYVTGIPFMAQIMRNVNTKLNKKNGILQAEKQYHAAGYDIATRNLKEDEKAFDEALITGGIAVDEYISEVTGKLSRSMNSYYSRGVRVLSYFFSQAEIFNRRTAGLAMYRFLRDSGYDFKGGLQSPGGQEVINYIHNTHYLMGKANLPLAAMGGELTPQLIRGAYTFRSFTHNYLLSMLPQYGGDWRVRLHSLAYLALLGGLASLPWLKDIFDWWEKKTGTSPMNEVRGFLNKYGGKTLEEFGINGLVGMALGDISGSLAIGIPFMGEPTDTLYGVWGGMVKKAGKGLDARGRGDYVRAAENLSPEFIANTLRALRMSSIGHELIGTPGYATTEHGRPLFDDNGKPLSMSTTEAIKKMIGFQPVDYSAKMGEERRMNNIETYYNERRQGISDRYRIAMLNGNTNRLPGIFEEMMKFNVDRMKDKVTLLVPILTLSTLMQNAMPLPRGKEKKEVLWKATND